MAEFDKNHFLWRSFAMLALTGLVSGNKLDEILDDTELLLYVAIGFLIFSILFLFIVILLISIVTIKIQKIKEEREDIPTMSRDVSETIITNPHVLPLPGRTLNDPYLPTQTRYGTGVASLNGAANMDYLDYMDLIIMDAANMNIPRAKKVESGEKTV